MSNGVHHFEVAGEFQHEGFLSRIVLLETCEEPDCPDCAHLDGDPFRAFTAPYSGRTDEFLYMGFGNDFDTVVAELADTISADLESGDSIFVRACAFAGVPWTFIETRPVQTIKAHERAVGKLKGERLSALLSTSISDLRKVRHRTMYRALNMNGAMN